MHRNLLTGSSLVLGFSLLAAPAAGAQQPTFYWFCTNWPADNGKQYLTPIAVRNSNVDPVADFTAYLAKKYGVSVTKPQCYGYQSQAAAMIQRRRIVSGARNQNRELVETDWSPGAAVGAPAPAAAPAPPPAALSPLKQYQP